MGYNLRSSLIKRSKEESNKPLHVNENRRRSRRVSFSDEVNTKLIESKSELSSKECEDVWYNNGEFTKFKISNHKDASTARSNESQPYKNLLKAYRAAESTNESSVITSLQKWLDSSDPSESYRGIENMCNQEFRNLRQGDQHYAVWMVLQTQKENRKAVKIKRRSSSCSEDEEKLRKVSEKVTMKSRRFAQAMGTVDSMEVTGIRPKSNSIVKRLSKTIRAKKTVTPVS